MGAESLGFMGYAAAIGLSAAGSALGTGIAGMAAVGAWKRCFVQNKPAPFALLIYVGAPFTQTLYGFLLMRTLVTAGQKLVESNALALNYMYLLAGGLFGGIAIGTSAILQGKAAAAASDSYAETGEGMTNNLIVLGIVESVAIFAMVFIMLVVGKLGS